MKNGFPAAKIDLKSTNSFLVPLRVYSTYTRKGTKKGSSGCSLSVFGFSGGEFAGSSGEFRGVRTPFFSRIFGGRGTLRLFIQRW